MTSTDFEFCFHFCFGFEVDPEAGKQILNGSLEGEEAEAVPLLIEKRFGLRSWVYNTTPTTKTLIFGKCTIWDVFRVCLKYYEVELVLSEARERQTSFGVWFWLAITKKKSKPFLRSQPVLCFVTIMEDSSVRNQLKKVFSIGGCGFLPWNEDICILGWYRQGVICTLWI